MEITSGKFWPEVKQRAFYALPFPPGLRDRLLRASTGGVGTVDEVCQLNFLMGELLAEAVLGLLRQEQMTPEQIYLIGSHGQTIHHLPHAQTFGPYSQRSTLQIGEPSVIAERTGITTVADFRPRDIAAGGFGAPLLPYLHFVLFRRSGGNTIVQNIGGIANLTYIPMDAQLNQVVAFDTGPGNILIDGMMSRLYPLNGQDGHSFDHGGRIAARGKLNQPLLDSLLSHPYFELQPPKTTGREVFGDAMLDDIHRQAGLQGIRPEDLIHTLTRFTARSIAQAYKSFILNKYPVDDIWVAGGGSQNHTMMDMLAEELVPLPVYPLEKAGYPSKALEAMGFALLAYQTIRFKPNNLPIATGASHPVIMGKIVWGKNPLYP